MSKLLKKNKLPEDNSFHISQIAGSLGSKKGSMTLNIENFTGTLDSTKLDWNNTGEWLVTSFRVTDNMSASDDIIIIVSCAEPFSVQASSIKWYIAAIKTDDTETFSWNILNGVAQTVSSSANNRIVTLTKTIAHADFDQDDMIKIYIENNTDADVDIYNISITFTEA